MWYNHPGQMPRVCPLNMNDQEIIFMSIRKMTALCLALILLCPVFQAAGAEELRPVLYDAIITRNVRDFRQSKVIALTPGEWLERL